MVIMEFFNDAMALLGWKVGLVWIGGVWFFCCLGVAMWYAETREKKNE